MRRSGSRKGTPFERKLCKWLDTWWARGLNLDRDESYFWRTAGSGARATVRAKKGKKTSSHYGDITNTHPSSKWLLKLFTIEAKKGYNHTANVHDLLDKPKRSKTKMIEEFIAKAKGAAEYTKAFAWMVIHERDRRKTMIYVPHRLIKVLANEGCFPGSGPSPYGEISYWVKFPNGDKMREIVCVLPLFYFLKRVSPQIVKALGKKHKKGEQLI